MLVFVNRFWPSISNKVDAVNVFVTTYSDEVPDAQCGLPSGNTRVPTSKSRDRNAVILVSMSQLDDFMPSKKKPPTL